MTVLSFDCNYTYVLLGRYNTERYSEPSIHFAHMNSSFCANALQNLIFDNSVVKSNILHPLAPSDLVLVGSAREQEIRKTVWLKHSFPHKPFFQKLVCEETRVSKTGAWMICSTGSFYF